MQSKPIENPKAYRHGISKVIAQRTLVKIQREMATAEGYEVFQYLRNLGPYVFEDLILARIAQFGCKTTLNWNFSGDGGLDGSFHFQTQRFNVQSKRYSGYINNTHVSHFVAICQKWNTPGLFFHTGKTGKKSFDTYKAEPLFQMVSGQRLLSFLLDDECSFFHTFLSRHA